MNYFQRLKQSSVLRAGVTYALSGCVLLLISVAAHAANVPSRALKGMVVSANAQSSQIGVDVMRAGGKVFLMLPVMYSSRRIWQHHCGALPSTGAMASTLEKPPNSSLPRCRPLADLSPWRIWPAISQ